MPRHLTTSDVGTTVQGQSAQLALIAALTTTAFGRSLLESADAAALRALAALGTVATLASDTDATLAANSDARVATQKAIKSYVDGLAQGLSPKGSSRVATTAALPANTYLLGVLTAVANGALSVDGVSVAVNDRVLVKNEAAGANNGLYVVTQTGDGASPYILTRASDMDANAEVAGAFSFVEDGTVNSGAGFVVASSGPFTIGTTVINWTQFSGAGEITAGNALTKSGNTLDVAVDGTTIEINADALRIKDGGVSFAKLVDIATARLLGRVTGGSGDPEELTGTQATTLLDVFTSALKGLVPASGGGTTNFLRADGTFAAPTATAADPSYSPGSFTVATETSKTLGNHVNMTGSQRITVQGTGRLRIVN